MKVQATQHSQLDNGSKGRKKDSLSLFIHIQEAWCGSGLADNSGLLASQGSLKT
jgi:hypothetical protein